MTAGINGSPKSQSIAPPVITSNQAVNAGGSVTPALPQQVDLQVGSIGKSSIDQAANAVVNNGSRPEDRPICNSATSPAAGNSATSAQVVNAVASKVRDLVDAFGGSDLILGDDEDPFADDISAPSSTPSSTGVDPKTSTSSSIGSSVASSTTSSGLPSSASGTKTTSSSSSTGTTSSTKTSVTSSSVGPTTSTGGASSVIVMSTTVSSGGTSSTSSAAPPSSISLTAVPAGAPTAPSKSVPGDVSTSGYYKDLLSKASLTGTHHDQLSQAIDKIKEGVGSQGDIDWSSLKITPEPELPPTKFVLPDGSVRYKIKCKYVASFKVTPTGGSPKEINLDLMAKEIYTSSSNPSEVAAIAKAYAQTASNVALSTNTNTSSHNPLGGLPTGADKDQLMKNGIFTIDFSRGANGNITGVNSVSPFVNDPNAKSAPPKLSYRASSPPSGGFYTIREEDPPKSGNFRVRALKEEDIPKDAAGLPKILGNMSRHETEWDLLAYTSAFSITSDEDLIKELIAGGSSGVAKHIKQEKEDMRALQAKIEAFGAKFETKDWLGRTRQTSGFAALSSGPEFIRYAKANQKLKEEMSKPVSGSGGKGFIGIKALTDRDEELTRQLGENEHQLSMLREFRTKLGVSPGTKITWDMIEKEKAAFDELSNDLKTLFKSAAEGGTLTLEHIDAKVNNLVEVKKNLVAEKVAIKPHIEKNNKAKDELVQLDIKSKAIQRRQINMGSFKRLLTNLFDPIKPADINAKMVQDKLGEIPPDDRIYEFLHNIALKAEDQEFFNELLKDLPAGANAFEEIDGKIAAKLNSELADVNSQIKALEAQVADIQELEKQVNINSEEIISLEERASKLEKLLADLSYSTGNRLNKIPAKELDKLDPRDKESIEEAIKDPKLNEDAIQFLKEKIALRKVEAGMKKNRNEVDSAKLAQARIAQADLKLSASGAAVSSTSAGLIAARQEYIAAKKEYQIHQQQLNNDFAQLNLFQQNLRDKKASLVKLKEAILENNRTPGAAKIDISEVDHALSIINVNLANNDAKIQKYHGIIEKDLHTSVPTSHGAIVAGGSLTSIASGLGVGPVAGGVVASPSPSLGGTTI